MDILSPTGIEKPVGGELHSRAQYLRNLDRINQVAIDTDKESKGLVYIKKVTVNTGALTDAIAENIASFTFKANRKYRIVWDFSYHATGNSDSLFFCNINTAAVADAAALITGLTVLSGRTKALVTAYALQGAQHTGPIECYYEPVADVTTQIKFRVERVLGDDGLTVFATVNEPAIYAIYDDGMQL